MHTTVQAAKRIGVSKNTLLRWIADGLIPDVGRDWRGWRVWSATDVARAAAFRRAYHTPPMRSVRQRMPSRGEHVRAAAESLLRSGRAWEKRGIYST
jgi:DNA-binding transcriptional MerR regulator